MAFDISRGFSERRGLHMQYTVRTKDGSSWFIDSIDHKWQHLIPHDDSGSIIVEEGPMLACTTVKLGKEITFFLPVPGGVQTGAVGKMIHSAPVESIEFGEKLQVAVPEEAK